MLFGTEMDQKVVDINIVSRSAVKDLCMLDKSNTFNLVGTSESNPSATAASVPALAVAVITGM